MLLSANIFQPLIDVFAAVLKFFHNDVGVGWGLAIVLLTVAVRLLLVPLGIKQFHSMQRMAMHMPEMKAIRERYKDNPQRMQQETMKFYKENNVNPFSSCVPLLIQWPFLIGLFWTLRGNLRLDICAKVQRTFENHYAAVHHLGHAAVAGKTRPCGTSDASFLFIHDLTDKATRPLELVLLLGLYIGTSVLSSRIMMMPGTDRNQRRLMMVLPVVFALITIQFPAGALLYYIIFNLWMIVQQSVFKELIGKQYRHPADVAIGIPGEGSVSSGGGLSGLLGFGRRHVDANATAPAPSSAAFGATSGGAARAGRARAGNSTAAGTTPKVTTTSATRTEGTGSTTRATAPPPSPRKKKKRSGRRR